MGEYLQCVCETVSMYSACVFTVCVFIFSPFPSEHLGQVCSVSGSLFLNSSPFFFHLYGLADTGLENSCKGVASTGMQLLILLAISCKRVASRGMQLLVLLAKSWKGRLAEESDY